MTRIKFLILSSFVGLWGCANPGGESSVKRAPELIRLTWKEYRGLEDPARASFLLNGEEIGRGEAALERIARTIDDCPKGSILLVYPFYQLTTGENSPNRVMPLIPEVKFGAVLKHQQMLLVLSGDGNIENSSNRVWHKGTWWPIQEFRAQNGWPTISSGQDGHIPTRPGTVVSGLSEDGTSSFRVDEILDFRRREVRTFVFSPATRRLFVSHTDKKDDRLYQWAVDAVRLEHIYRLGEGFLCDYVAASPNGRFLIVGCWPLKGFGGKTLILDTQQHAIVHDLDRQGRVFSVQFSAEGTRFFLRTSTTYDEDSGGVVYDISGNRIRDFDPNEFVSGGDVHIWRIPPSKEAVNTHGLYCRDARGQVHRLTDNEWGDNYALTKDARYLAATTWGGELLVWRLADTKLVFEMKMAQQYGFLQYDPKANRFLWADATSAGTTKLKALHITATSGAAQRVIPSVARDLIE
jgi:hypothetical protein